MAENVEIAADRVQRQIIRREGEYWILVFAGSVCRLGEGRGINHLAYLLLHPHEAISSLFLDYRTARDDAATARVQIGGHDARERARVNVTRATDDAIRRISAHHPELGEHLSVTIRTGVFCSYTPDPRLPVQWTD